MHDVKQTARLSLAILVCSIDWSTPHVAPTPLRRWLTRSLYLSIPAPSKVRLSACPGSTVSVAQLTQDNAALAPWPIFDGLFLLVTAPGPAWNRSLSAHSPGLSISRLCRPLNNIKQTLRAPWMLDVGSVGSEADCFRRFKWRGHTAPRSLLAHH